MKYSTGSRGSSLSGPRSGMKRVSRPAVRQRERGDEQGKQPAWRRGIGQFAAERLARIGQRVRDQFLLFAAPGRGDFHLEARLYGERIGQKLGFLDRMRQQHQPGWRLVVVDLR